MSRGARTLEQAEADVALLRRALVGLVGVSDEESLSRMELAVRMLPQCDEDKAVTLNAIHALRQTAPL